MNILIPHSWLLEHLETNADVKEIQSILSLSGPSVEHIYDREGEPVFDIEVTTNRVDSMSIRGIAREASVILNHSNRPSKLKPLNLPNKKELAIEGAELILPQINNNPDLCKRIMCVVLKNVKRTPTPPWMAKRLLQTDMNVHDSVIDITNYITHELGHPCHAFDYDKIRQKGGIIYIEEAKTGEKFSTLDGLEFETVGGEVVFKNGQNEIIDLPSIKGTTNTAIDDSTTNVLLLLESIIAPKVRFASMTHAIRTTAAQLMEKNVDPNLAELVMIRGIQLYQELCHAQIGSPIYDDFPEKTQTRLIEISQEKINNYLGIDLDQTTITSILENLGCGVNSIKQNNSLIYQVIPPSFRPDLNIPADIIEELARIYGYHNLPSQLMATPIPTIKPENLDLDLENKIKTFLAYIGWQEIYSYSMVSEKLAMDSEYKIESHLKLSNPLTDDKVYLRRSLIPSLLEVIEQNPSSAQSSVFELAKVYHPQENQLPAEELRLTLVSNKPYQKVKGDLGSLFNLLHISNIKVVPNPQDKPTQSGKIMLQNADSDQNVVVGKILILSNNNVAVDIEFNQLLNNYKKHPRYQPLPKTAQIVEDLTFTFPEKTYVGEVLSLMSKTSELVYKIELKDVYNNNHSFTITYWDETKNLSSEDIEPVRREIVQAVERSFGAKLVGKL